VSIVYVVLSQCLHFFQSDEKLKRLSHCKMRMAEQWLYLETPSVRAGFVIICRCLPLLLQPLAEVAILSEGIKRDAKDEGTQ